MHPTSTDIRWFLRRVAARARCNISLASVPTYFGSPEILFSTDMPAAEVSLRIATRFCRKYGRYKGLNISYKRLTPRFFTVGIGSSLRPPSELYEKTGLYFA